MKSVAAAISVLLLAACTGRGPAQGALRVGHFPNVTHAHGLIAHQLSRQDKGWFESRLGAETKLEWYTYNAGPSAMEALLAGAIDLAYVGPNPAINAHLRSKGEEVRVVAGAVRGGAALVVQGDGRIRSPADFRGKTVATPQFGNTQDVACRAWLAEQGFRITQQGGDVKVLPTQNPDQLGLFQSGQLDAVWTVEPWVSQLELTAGGKLYLEESDAVTTVLVASASFLRDRGDLARRFVAAHAELTEWIRAHPEEAQAMVRAELMAETGREMPQELLARCWPRLEFRTDTSQEAFDRFVRAAKGAGFLPDATDISRLVESPR